MLNIKHFFDQDTYTLTYVVSDSESKDAIIIDPVLNYDPASGQVSCESLAQLDEYIQSQSLKVRGILETHAHADHLTSSQYLKKTYPEAVLAVSEKITLVQETFKPIFNLTQLETSGNQFDRLLKNNEDIQFGTIALKVLATPGHTPACTSFLIEDNLFVGDSIFMPDYGCGRCDFPMGSATDLYHSITQVIYQLPETTKIFVGHDYQPEGRELKFQTTVGESKAHNIQLNSERSQEDFVKFRTERDATLSTPKLLLPSIQVNIDAGRLPTAESNGTRYLKIPLK